MDDRALISRVQAGERDAFRELLERHTPPLLATLRSAVGRDQAREILQETWLRAWEGLGNLRDPARLRSWLLSIALNQVRSGFRRPSDPTHVEPDTIARGEEEGADRLGRLEDLARLRMALAELPPRQREVVDLRVNHELSHGEIADLLGISEEASRANHYQGLRRLRARLGEDQR